MWFHHFLKSTVSKEEYDSCRITNSNPRIIAICDKPHQLKYFTITFRSFTPQPGGLEFKPGQDYYFISTSTGKREGLDRRLGGRCSTHHMKVIFKVCCSTNDNNVLNDKSDANNIKNNSNINSTINNNQSFSSTTVDSSSLSSSELSIESSSSSSIASSSLSSADLHSDDRSNANGLYLNANINNINSLVSTSSPPSTSTTLGSLVTSTFPASPEHWWRPHFTRIQDLKWRSKGPGNVVKETNHHHLTVGHDSNSFTNPNANNSQNNSSNDTLRPIAWTIFAIACFIFIIFWALWCKVRRNNVMLPMSK
uniref:Ephrin RBD domain-containing protein n=1 Tax=Tetranychus urticae TaxID=32264 RepID=T1KN04_TETUR